MAKRAVRTGPVSASVHTLAELLTGDYRFRLPWFQRAYAWRVENVGRLLTNVREAMRLEGRKRHYLLGSILLADSQEGAAAALVDGHQRIMTLTILFAVLRDAMRDETWKRRLHAFVAAPLEDGEERRHVIIDAELAVFVALMVQDPGATENEPEDDLLSLSETERNIVENRDYLRAELSAVNVTDEQRQALATFLAEHCRVIVHEVDDEEEAWRWLQIEEDTRLDFSAADRSKASIISAMPADEREEAGRYWDECQTLLGAHDMRALLGHVRNITLHSKPNAPVESELIVAYHLNASGIAFMRDEMWPMAHRLALLRSRSIGEGGARDAAALHIDRLEWVDKQLWVGPALQWMKLRGGESEGTVDFFRLLERLFWLLRIAGIDPSVQQTRMFRLIEQIATPQAPQAMETLHIEARLKDLAIANLRSNNFHAKHHSGAVLRRICVALGADPGPVDGKAVTVEHVLPRKPSDTSQWRKDFNKRKPIASYVNRLGNLAFLTEPLNQQAGAQDYETKRVVFRESSDRLIQHALGYAVWTPDTIEHRTRDLTRILLEGWGLEL